MTAPAAAARHRLALFDIGFRPFFLLAGLFAAVDVPLWLHIRSGDLDHESHLGGLAWHGHEMVFGFAIAVFTGFLLTAAQNWTGRVTARGLPLALLALLWMAGRALLLVGDERLQWVTIAVDSLFLPVLALVLLRPIWLARNRRNLVFPIALLLLGALNLCVHLAALDLVPVAPERFIWLALGLIAVLMTIVGGRVIPVFTGNALPKAGVTTWSKVDVAAIAAAAAIPAADIVAGQGAILGVAALAAGAIGLLRMVPWRGWATRRQPILWILHLGYLWLALAFLLRGAAVFGWVPDAAAIHALGVGAVGTLTLAMMSRVALGHSGRPIVAAPLTAAAYALVVLAGITRLAAIWQGEAFMHAAGIVWSLGWILFLIVYTPICIGRRRVS